MLGFIKGVLGFNKKVEDETQQQSAPAPKLQKAPKSPKDSTAYYLSFDDAQTYGNIEYMRTAKTVRRTFAKTAGSKTHKETNVSISAMQKVDALKKLQQISEANGGIAPVPKVDETAERRRGDSSMDMFRNMAREYKR